MKLGLLTLVMLYIITLGYTEFIEVSLKSMDQLDIPRINDTLVKQGQKQVSINANQNKQKIGDRDKIKSNAKNVFDEDEDPFRSSDGENSKLIQSQLSLLGKKRLQLNLYTEQASQSKNRLLNLKIINKIPFKQEKTYLQGQQVGPQVHEIEKTYKQMDDTTIYMIMISTFLISIPIVREVRTQNSKQITQNRKKNKKIRYCKHTKHLLISVSQAQKQIFPNLAGYNKLFNESKIQS